MRVGIIMDGNGRWAKIRGLPRVEGHRQGARAVLTAVEAAITLGVSDLTLFAFSTENWARPETEVSFLMRLLALHLRLQRRRIVQLGVRFKPLGRIDELAPPLQKELRRLESSTEGNARITVRLALNYGGRREIVDAVRRVLRSGVPPDEIDERSFANFLYHSDLSDIDLLIRTGGEMRISNFLLWQSAYAELFFTPVLWPDFCYNDFSAALEEFRRRARRFGRVLE